MAGSLASPGANVAVADPSLIGRIIAAWPSVALIGSYELLMSQIRQTTRGRARAQDMPTSRTERGIHADIGPTEQQEGQEEDADFAAEHSRNGRALQRAAWRWAQQNWRADGDLPSGVAIARAFARSPRWGRLVKSVGLAGELVDAEI
ncbi:hypothetical protein [Microtetraspora malaysiensis]|uniref:Uncharacterized protein n=1 Tax=Microtetraspora malaysiensis TaxID=161358 RepID=A0ABW6SXU3_9ACTN